MNVLIPNFQVRQSGKLNSGKLISQTGDGQVTN
jgi:hypothetical protein